MPVPFPFKIPETVVDKVIAGVVVEVATVPAKPLADTMDAVVTVPPLPADVNIPPDKLKPDPIVIDSILPVNAVLLPNSVLVDIVCILANVTALFAIVVATVPEVLVTSPVNAG